MSFLGSAAGSIIGGIGEYFGTSSANSLQQSLFNQQIAFNKEVMQNRHQWEVEDLKKAGLNPLLSATTGTGTLSAPIPPSTQKANYAQSAAQLATLAIQDKQANAMLNSAEAAKISAEASRDRLTFDSGKSFDFSVESWSKDFELRSKLADSQINSASAQTKLTEAQTLNQKIQNVYLPYILEGNLSEQDQRIMIAGAEAAADIKLKEAQTNATLSDAESNRILARTAERNGVSQRALNSANYERIYNDIAGSKYETRLRGNSAYDFADTLGQIIHVISPFTNLGIGLRR
nr:minor tail protein [Microvirus sp.]